MSLGVAESLLALCFGDLDTIDSPTLVKGAPIRELGDFEGWTLLDLLVSRFPDIGRPTLRFEVTALIAQCGGDPIKLLSSTLQRKGSAVTNWSHRFPLGIFAINDPIARKVGFDIADCHLHSGASVPLPLFFSALASTPKPIDGSQLVNKKLISSGGVAWDLHTLLAATRWALWLLRWVRGGRKLDDVHAYVEHGFHEDLVTAVLEGTYWTRVREAGTNSWPADPIAAKLGHAFKFKGLCNIQEILWRVWSSKNYEFPGLRPLFTGLIRACVGIASQITARPGDGLSRFVDRFEEMGLTRDAAFGDLRDELLVPTLKHVALSEDVVGAEFRKTVIADSRSQFRTKVRRALADHHRAFAKFVAGNGNDMALSMPVGFIRRPRDDEGRKWTDLRQLQEACHGVNALSQILAEDDGTIARAISTTDVAGDEYGSASWPFAAAAELMRRRGLGLGYAIHAGEAFSSPLNGLRRIGELYLADRYPDRIGHALALSEKASAAVCLGGIPPPIRIGDAVCDLAWAWGQGCGDPVKARGLISRLVAGPGGQALPADAWLDAYQRLFSVDALIEHRVVVEEGSEYVAGDAETLEAIAARSESNTVRALTALACGAVSDIAHIDVKEPVPNELKPALAEFDLEAAPAARELTTKLVRDNSAIEVCPSSNLRLAKLGEMKDHPVWEWQQDRIEVIVGSDDPIIFGATIADEFAEMLNVRNETTVAEIAAAGMLRCSGGLRRQLSDFEDVVLLMEGP
jgi:hypothetical protein